MEESKQNWIDIITQGLEVMEISHRNHTLDISCERDNKPFSFSLDWLSDY
jgi:phosphoserine aminotransferase